VTFTVTFTVTNQDLFDSSRSG